VRILEDNVCNLSAIGVCPSIGFEFVLDGPALIDSSQLEFVHSVPPPHVWQTKHHRVF